MSQQSTTSFRNFKKNQFTDLKTVLAKYFFHWPLFVLGMLIALFCAIVYLKVSQPVYQINATILVKDEKKTPNEKSGMDELDLSNAPKNAETEIQVITSKTLLAQVVTDLGLNVSYQRDGFLSNKAIYEKTPIKILTSAINQFTKPKEIFISIADDKTFTVKSAGAENKKYSFGQTVEDDLGKWTLQATPYLKQYIKSTIKITVTDPKKFTDVYAKKLDARLLDKSAPTIGLFLNDELPQRGKEFLDDLIKVYNQASATEEKRRTKSTIEFINQRLASLTGELKDAENKVENYRSSQGLTDISMQSKVYLENAQANDAKLNDVNVQLSNIEGIERYVNSSAQNMAPATGAIQDASLNDLIKNLADLEQRHAKLLSTTPEANPLFAPINSQIKSTKDAIRQNVRGIKASLLSAKAELKGIDRKVESEIKEIPGQERQYIGMKRQESIKENLYVYLLQKREEFTISYASTQADARIVDSANVGEITWPRPSLVIAIAILLGLGIPFMIIYFRYAFNRTVTTRQEIESLLDLPLIGDISFGELGSSQLVIGGQRNVVGEQFRSIRTNLYLQHQKLENIRSATALPGGKLSKDTGRITLCTSSTSQEGKSFVSSNLALTIAASGRKTVLLEMDLRRPKIGQVFSLKRGHLGISDFITSNVSLDSIIQPSNVEDNLYIVTSGKTIDYPSELLESKKLGELLSNLREQFDDIIIDTPPLHLVTDAMIISRFADISLYVIRQGFTGKDELTFIGELADSAQLPNINLIFNGVNEGKYGYGYNYDNSYYLKDEKQSTKRSSWDLILDRL